MSPFTRRRALRVAAGASAFALAGCSALGGDCRPRVELQLTSVDDADVAESAADAPDEMRPVPRSLVEDAVEDGTATYHSAISRPFVYGSGYVRVDGSYYSYAVEAVAEGTVDGTVLHLHQDDVTDADGQSGDVVAFDDLPTYDRRTFLALLEAYGGGYLDDLDRFFEQNDGVDIEHAVGYLDAGRAGDSLLVPDPAHDYVRFHGHHFAVEATGTREISVTTYEVAVEAVEGGADAVAAARLDAAGRDLATHDLPPEQRDILDQATEGTYSECADYSEALQGVRDLLDPVAYVRYEGTWYRALLSEWSESRE